MKKLLPALLAAFCACSLTSCITTPTAGSPFAGGDLPPGVVRGPDGMLRLDPNAPQTAREAAAMNQMGRPRDVVSHWDGGPGNGPARIRIVLSEQTAYFFRGSQLVGKSWLSTGDEAHRTPTGNFRIMQKDKHHRSSRYGVFVDAEGNVVDGDVDYKNDPVPKGCRYEGADMKNFMRLTAQGVGMHAGFLPGYPASHGCIRMPEHMSEHFFNNVEVGTPVTIVP
jgi:L,D-transpeptidase catalytic domain